MHNENLQSGDSFSSLIRNFRFRFWQELTNVSMLGMELLLIVAWHTAFITGGMNWEATLMLLAAAMLGSYLLARLVFYARLKPVYQQSLFIIWAVFILLFTSNLILFPGQAFNPVRIITSIASGFFNNEEWREFIHLFLTAILLLRGIILAREPATRYDVIVRFGTGILIFLVYGMVFLRGNLFESSPILFLYLTVGLLGLIASRISSLGRIYSSRIVGINSGWLIALVLVILITVGVSFLAGRFADLYLDELLLKAFSFLFYAVLIASLIALAPLLLLIVFIMEKLLENFEFSLEGSPMEGVQDILQDITQEQAKSSVLIETLLKYSKVIIFAVLLLIIVITAVIILRKTLLEQKFNGEDEHSKSNSDKKKNAFQDFLEKLRQPQNLIDLRRLIGAARIRRTYARLMNLCSRLGKARPASKTPLEFLPSAQQLFEQEQGELALITNAYIKIRYGELPENDEEVQAVEAAWDKIEAAGKIKLAEQKKIAKKRAK